MESGRVNTIRKSIAAFIIGAVIFGLAACAKDTCPTYMNANERSKSAKSRSNYKGSSSIPSPYNEKYAKKRNI
ncbi:MAG TPA: hypothetical protein VHO46_06095 [Bacteroidales bacterium]|nr:hypothetical protein [Bacteroidales bacterium]